EVFAADADLDLRPDSPAPVAGGVEGVVDEDLVGTGDEDVDLDRAVRREVVAHHRQELVRNRSARLDRADVLAACLVAALVGLQIRTGLDGRCRGKRLVRPGGDEERRDQTQREKETQTNDGAHDITLPLAMIRRSSPRSPGMRPLYPGT